MAYPKVNTKVPSVRVPKIATSQPLPSQDEPSVQPEIEPVAPELTEEEIQANQEAREAEIAKIQEIQQYQNNVETAVKEKIQSYDGDYSSVEYSRLIAVLGEVRSQQAEAKTLLEKATEKDEDDEDLLTLENLAILTIALGSGVQVAESIDKMINGDDVEQLDAREEISKNVDAITDPVNRQKIINATFGDNAQLSDLENLSAYNNQFGSLSSDMFNGPDGQLLEQTYQEFLKANPDIDRDQFLVEFARQNPFSPISQNINQKLSRMGQLDRGASEFGQIDRNTMIEGFQDASNFYKPKGQGGYGFQPQDFRSQEQNQVVDRALGLMDGPEAQLLRRNAMERVQQGGALPTDTLRDITANSLTGVDPSLQAQPYLRSGGLAKSILNTSEAQRKRQFDNEASLYSILQGDRNYMPSVSGVVNTGNVDPVSALGLAGKNSSINANNAYQTNPTEGYNYDPTSGYFGSVTTQNANINMANNMQPSTGENITDLGTGLGNLNTNLQPVLNKIKT